MSNNYPPGGDGSDPGQAQGFGQQASNQPGSGYGQQPGQGAPGYGSPQQPTPQQPTQPTYGPPGSQPSAGQPPYGQQPTSQPSPYGQQPASQPSPYGTPGQQPAGQGPYVAPGQYGAPGQQYGAPGQQPGYGQPGYAPTGPTGSGRKSGGRSKLPFILGGGGLALVIVVVLIIVLVVHSSASSAQKAIAAPTSGTTAGTGKTSAPSSAPSQASPQSASGVVQDYLNALAAGNATKALSDLSQQPSDTSLMTDTVLKASLKAAPLTDIKVPKVTDQYAFEVDASYKLGSRPVNAKFDVDNSSGSYLVDQGYAEIDLGDLTNGLPLTVNGVKTSADKVDLFPGSYQLGTTAKYISLGSSANFLVQQPDDFPDIEPKPVLTAQGQAIFKQKVTAAIQACVRSMKLNPGCGLNTDPKTDDGDTVKENSVHRTLTADAKAQIKNMTATLDFDNPTVAEDEDFSAEVNTSAVLTKGKVSRREHLIFFGDGNEFGEPELDMSRTTLVVHWG